MSKSPNLVVKLIILTAVVALAVLPGPGGTTPTGIAAGKSLAFVYVPAANGPQPGLSGKPWLDYLNFLRTQAALPPVTDNPAWTDGEISHSRYMVKTGDTTHYESFSSPWYTPEGDVAGQRGNVGLNPSGSISDVNLVKEFVTRPLHMVGFIDPALKQSAFGSYREGQTGVTIDVTRGRFISFDGITFPVIWPGNGSTVEFTSYPGLESPDPLSSCPGYTVPSGLPIIAFRRGYTSVPPVVKVSLTKDGAPVEHCWYDGFSYTNPNVDDQPNTRVSLQNHGAMVIIPRQPLQPGATYTVSVTLDGLTGISTFHVAG